MPFRRSVDPPPQHIAAARQAGVKFAIDTDAHSMADLDHMRYGAAAAGSARLSRAT
jgi:histidinol phosphatase-like PHP family hydrolase